MIGCPGHRPGLLVQPSPRERSMTWFVLVHLVGFLVDVLTVVFDNEIWVLAHFRW